MSSWMTHDRIINQSSPGTNTDIRHKFDRENSSSSTEHCVSQINNNNKQLPPSSSQQSVSVCRYCDKCFVCPASLDRHMLNIHSSYRYVLCCICERMIKRVSFYDHTVSVHSSNNTLQLASSDDNVCSLRSNSDKRLCSICKKTFKSTNSLKEHVGSVHSQILIKSSWPSAQEFDRFYNRNIHTTGGKTSAVVTTARCRRKIVHNSARCSICEKTFKNRLALEVHISRAHMIKNSIESKKVCLTRTNNNDVDSEKKKLPLISDIVSNFDGHDNRKRTTRSYFQNEIDKSIATETDETDDNESFCSSRCSNECSEKFGNDVIAKPELSNHINGKGTKHLDSSNKSAGYLSSTNETVATDCRLIDVENHQDNVHNNNLPARARTPSRCNNKQPVCKSLGYSCSYCHKRFTQRYNARKHERNIHNVSECAPSINKTVATTRYSNDTENHQNRIRNNTSPTAHASSQSYKRTNLNSDVSKKNKVRKSFGEYFCLQCHKQFRSRYHARRHKQNAHSSLRYKCDICERIYKNKDSLRYHMKSCHNKRVKNSQLTAQRPVDGLKMNVCDVTKELCNKSKHDVHKSLGYSCSYCHKRFTQRHNVRKHERNIHNVSECVPSINKTVATTHYSNDTENHQNRVRNNTSPTAHASSQINKRTNLNSDVSTKNKVPKSLGGYFCSKCHKQFKYKHSAIRHEQDIHGSLRYKCDICERILKSKDSLRWHMKSSHNKLVKNSQLSAQRPFDGLEMNICDVTKELCNKSKHDVHKSLGYSCSYCHKRFTQRHNVRKHERNIHNVSECVPSINKTVATTHYSNDTGNHQNRVRNNTSPTAHASSRINKRTNLNSDVSKKNKVPKSLGEYFCSKCHKQFKYKHGAIRHEQNAHSSLRYKCDICERILKSKDSLRWHMKSCHNKRVKNFQLTAQRLLDGRVMNICDVTMELYNKSKHDVHKSLGYSCSYCHKRFTQRHNVRRHELYVRNVSGCAPSIKKTVATTRYSNDTENHQNRVRNNTSSTAHASSRINKRTNLNSDISKKKKVPNSLGGYFCSKCHKQFKYKYNVIRHEQDVHGSLRYKCDICERILKSKDSFRWHMKSFHNKRVKNFELTAQRPFDGLEMNICDVTKELYNKSKHDVHKSLGYSCSYCHKRFTQRHNVRRHELYVHNVSGCAPSIKKTVATTRYSNDTENHQNRVRNNTSPTAHASSQINKRTNLNSDVSKKNKVPNSLGLYFCSKCHKQFKYKHNAIRHEQDVHGSLRYKCDICERILKSKDSLRCHMKLSHKKRVKNSKLTAQ